MFVAENMFAMTTRPAKAIKRAHRDATYRRVTEERQRQVLHLGATTTVNVEVRRLRPKAGAPSLKAWALDRGITKRGGRWTDATATGGA